ncbi:MAG: ThiF family adenylyltransferase [Crinalium sp.]
MQLNYDFTKAHGLRVLNHSQVDITVVGLGGTGSWLAASVVRIARTLNNLGKKTKVTFVDPDIVESANVLRQCFCDSEIGLNKAKTLALRYSLAWGMEIYAIAAPFNCKMLDLRTDTLFVVIGCTDNAAARTKLAETLSENYYAWSTSVLPKVWYLDCGNSKTSGQVLLGSDLSTDPATYKFSGIGCIKLPSPTIQHPELLIPLLEELTENDLSCEQLAMLNAQSLDINQRVASEATTYLLGLVTGNLKRFATYFDTTAGSSRSIYLTEKAVLKTVKASIKQAA